MNLTELVKKVISRVCNIINNIIYYMCCIIPIDKNLIILESEGDLSDNAYAIYDYMRHNNYEKKYKIIWLVEDVKSAKYNIQDVKFIIKFPNGIEAKRSFYLARCKWYIYDHCNVISNLRKRKKQMLVYLTHGWGYKAPKGVNTKKNKSRCDCIMSTGELSAKGLSEFFQEPLDKVIITGYPRIDYFYKHSDLITATVNREWRFDKYKKVFFWMPTFRKSINTTISENYIDNQTGLPIFETKQSLYGFSKFLKDESILLVLKLHHLQANLPIFDESIDNIRVIDDNELKKCGIQLYQLIPYSDALISDYSSVSIDYMVLNRPIIYTLDDYEQYNKSRGLFLENTIDYMPGYHVYNADELKQSILEICNEIDKYKEERESISSQYHYYYDGESSKRVLDTIGVTKY